MSGPTEPADPGRPALDELIREMRRLRNRAGLSQRALAAKMGYVREYVTLGERGVRLPSREFLVRYAHALNATRTLLPLYQVARDEHQASTDAAHATRRQHALGLTDWEAAQMQALMESQAPTEQAGTGGGPPEKRATAEGGQVVDGAAVDTAPTATSPQMVSAQRRAGSTSWIISLEDGRPRIVPINGAAASVAATLPPSSLVDPDERERVVRIIDDPRRADLPLARDLGELLAQYRVLEDAIGPRRVMRPILPLCGLVDDIIRGARADAQQPLLRLAAQFEQFTGWLWVD